LNDHISQLQSADLAEKVHFLRQKSFYRHLPNEVIAVETHMSWVFLAGAFAFKLKKPVHYEFLDFTSLKDREFMCREEVRLNARLAPGIYLGVVPLHLDSQGQFTLKGDGPIADWLVKMKRLPADRMLDWVIEHGKAGETEIDAVAQRLVDFYRTAAKIDQSLEQVWQRFASEHDRNARLLVNPEFDLDYELTGHVIQNMASALIDVRPLLKQRVEQHVFVEGHGDLRPEHICLISEPVIIDCLEFKRDLRLLDSFEEIAFLDLECERLGAAWIGRRILGICRRELTMAPPIALIAFYRSARALLQARLALAHLIEPNPRTPQKWEPRARHYIALAEGALNQFNSMRVAS
jgi:aminoglycoside phosphotransferase family enzyme